MRYNKEQRKSISKWIGGSLLVGAFGFLTSWLMFSFAWLDRKKGKDSIFWWWMDDERYNPDGSYSSDYKAYLVRFGVEEENWWVAWNWHTRNAVWNLKRSKYLVGSTPAEVGNNNIDVVDITTDNLYRGYEDGSRLHLVQDGIWIATAGLKYIPKFEWQDKWQVNQGDVLSHETSILGEGMMWFRPKDKTELHFRYSNCKVIEYKILGIRIWRGWRTVKLGYGNKSYVMTIKHQSISRWE
jgi:hypothetical protein